MNNITKISKLFFNPYGTHLSEAYPSCSSTSFFANGKKYCSHCKNPAYSIKKENYHAVRCSCEKSILEIIDNIALSIAAKKIESKYHHHNGALNLNQDCSVSVPDLKNDYFDIDFFRLCHLSRYNESAKILIKSAKKKANKIIKNEKKQIQSPYFSHLLNLSFLKSFFIKK